MEKIEKIVRDITEDDVWHLPEHVTVKGISVGELDHDMHDRIQETAKDLPDGGEWIIIVVSGVDHMEDYIVSLGRKKGTDHSLVQSGWTNDIEWENDNE